MLLAIRNYPRYAWDPINNNVISFYMVPEGKPLKWVNKTGFYKDKAPVVVKLCSYGKSQEYTLEELQALILPREYYLGHEMEEQFIVAKLLNGDPQFTNKPITHNLEVDAVAECERLAKQNPGTEFSYFRRVKTCVVNNVQWK